MRVIARGSSEERNQSLQPFPGQAGKDRGKRDVGDPVVLHLFPQLGDVLVIIDTDGLDVDEVVKRIVERVKP